MQRQELLNQFYSEALFNGCKKLAKELIQLGANYHKRKSEATVALMEAAKNGDFIKVKQLSANDVNLVDDKNKTALMYASEEGHLSIVKYLLKKKADVLMKSTNGDHALKLASSNGHTEVADELINEICTNYKGVMWPLQDALEEAIRKKHKEISNKIAEKLETVSSKALEHAVENNDIEMAEKLIPKVRSINCPVGFNGHYTYAGIAAKHGFCKMCKMLLDAGVRVDEFYQYGAAPLYLASEEGHLDVVNMLLDEYDADPNLYDSGTIIQYTPIMRAAENNHSKVVRALANKKADINAYSHGVCKTALMWAAKKGAEESVRELIDLEADLNLTEPSAFGYGDTALSMVDKESNIGKMLRNAGAKTSWELRH